MTSLPAILRAEAERLGLSQPALAERSGVPQTSISDYLTGRKSPGYERLSALLAALGKSWGWLDKQGCKPQKLESQATGRVTLNDNGH